MRMSDSSTVLLNVTLETAQPLAPERFVVPQPLADRTQGPRIQFANTRRSVLRRSDQTHGSQQAKVLRNCRPARAKIRCDRADGVGTPAQQTQNLAAGGGGHCPQHPPPVPPAAAGPFKCANLVTNTVTKRLRTGQVAKAREIAF